MLRRAFAATGVDYEQWRTLTRVMLKIDLRGSSGLQLNLGSNDSSQRNALLGMAFFYFLIGMFLAAVTLVPDAFIAATMIFTVITFMAGSMVLIEYQSVVVSPNDYGILSFRPISSRTYFAVKLTNVMIYVAVICAFLGIPSVIMFGVRHGLGVGIAAAAALCSLGAWVALAMIVVYAAVLRFVHPKRLRRILSYLQMLMSIGIYGGYIILPRLISPAALRGIGAEKSFWMLLYPPTWFASFVDLAKGNVGISEIVPALTALASVAGLFWYATGKLSLSYAERLSALASTSEAAPTATPASAAGSPGHAARLASPSRSILRNEARAVSLLIRAQFRFDMKFRMSVLAIFPLTGLYLFLALREGTLPDPFVDPDFGGMTGLGMLHLTATFVPLMLLQSLAASDSFRAAWIFFATPADKSRLVVGAKNFVFTVFLVPYLAFVFAIFAYYFEDAVHAAVHVVVMGMVSSLVLQVIVLVKPELPFAKPVQKSQQSGLLFVLIFGSMFFTMAVLPAILWIAYATPARTVALLVALLGVGILLERLLVKRAQRLTSGLEFAV